eukprot:910295-Pelagomonas_calceolata.AAC.7
MTTSHHDSVGEKQESLERINKGLGSRKRVHEASESRKSECYEQSSQCFYVGAQCNNLAGFLSDQSLHQSNCHGRGVACTWSRVKGNSNRQH